MIDLRIRASPRHGGQDCFKKNLIIDLPRGRPVGGRRHSSHLMENVVKNSIKAECYDLHRVGEKLNTHRVFPPLLCLPPNAIIPEQVLRRRREKSRGMSGDRFCLLLHRSRCISLRRFLS